MGCIAGMMVYNKAYTESVGEDAMATQPCGTGPFAVEEWISSYGINYVRNEHYWGGSNVEVEFDNIEVRYYTETTTMMVDFETGALDIATYLPESDVKRIQNGEVPGASVYVTPSMGIYEYNLIVEQYDFSTAITYWQGTQNNGIPVNQMGILQLSPSTGDADQVMSTTKIGSGLTYVECNDEYVQELIQKGATTSDAEVRAEAYAELQQYMYEQCYQIPVIEDSNGFAIHDYIDWFDSSAPTCPRYCFTTTK